MNARKLAQIGVPADCINDAIQAVQTIAAFNRSVEKPRRLNVQDLIKQCVDIPEHMTGDLLVGDLARAIIDDANFVRPEPCSYRTWGGDNIDEASHVQMRQACSLPHAVAGALMPDAHVGYGLPIGGVLALEDAVCPYAVGVDIACRMKMTVYPLTARAIKEKNNLLKEALVGGTVFGVGQEQKKPQHHAVLDEDWSITRVTKDMKDRASKQIGTSGSGNHFVEWGTLIVEEFTEQFGLEPGEYIALLSHSGSRGPGSAVCQHYSRLAQNMLPKKYKDLGQLAWLSMETEEGQEYWAAMNLMGRYAAANHDVIHRRVSGLFGEKPIAMVENHHNFAWEENHGGKKLYVHRKGATPAGKGVLGVIPGSMGDPAYVVRGLGNADSLRSASHGAGRCMSRKKAKEIFNYNAVKQDLAAKGIEVLSAGADEVPGVYKNINEVMAQQTDLVAKIARFDPRIVLMCGDGSKAED